MKKKIKLSKAELQSGSSRVDWAEGLIIQLPKNHDGRNSWLLNYGTGYEAKRLRKRFKSQLRWNKKTCCLNSSGY